MPRLLLIDNSLTDSAQYMQMLAEEGYLVEHVASLAEGLARSTMRPFDALLLDLNLPDSQGLATYLAAREQLATMPIVVLTDLADDGTISAAYLQGVQDYLIKSKVTPDWLVQSVKHAMFRGQLLLARGRPAAEAEEPASEPRSVWTQEKIDDVIVLRLLPKRLMDANAILSIEERLTSLVERGHHHLVVDMENVEYISNSALGVLIGTQKKIRAKTGRLHLVHLGKNVRNQFEARQFHRLFRIYDDVAGALASISAAP